MTRGNHPLLCFEEKEKMKIVGFSNISFFLKLVWYLMIFTAHIPLHTTSMLEAIPFFNTNEFIAFKWVVNSEFQQKSNTANLKSAAGSVSAAHSFYSYISL